MMAVGDSRVSAAFSGNHCDETIILQADDDEEADTPAQLIGKVRDTSGTALQRVFGALDGRPSQRSAVPPIRTAITSIISRRIDNINRYAAGPETFC